ncbi:hypothetical protein QUB60_21915 [Microcoleus sp. A2-C5]|nr:hypothetical protein [Lyngbya sp. CCAP 1446/10]MCW6051825.1 hypothetical protein [Lyngbya sp. CCAP 1446/10]
MKEEGRRKREEGRGKAEEERGKAEEGRQEKNLPESSWLAGVLNLIVLA